MAKKWGIFIEELIKPSTRVLEVGCSSGDCLASLAGRYPNKDFTGIDINGEAIRKAHKNNTLPNLSFCCSDILTDRSVLGAYDLIFSHDTFVLFPFELKKRMIEILVSHLNPRGVLVINDFNPKVIAGNALGNLIRHRVDRTFLFLGIMMVFVVKSMLGMKRFPVAGNYYFPHRGWYSALGKRMGIQVCFDRNQGLFLDEGRSVPAFQARVDRLVRFRDLIVIRPKTI